MIKFIRYLEAREPSKWEIRTIKFLSNIKLRVKCWFIRKLFPTAPVIFKHESGRKGYVPQLGDIYVKRGVNMEYVGKNRWAAISKDQSTDLKIGIRIKKHFHERKKNDFILREGKIIVYV